MSLSIMHKDKSYHEWDEEEKCNRYYERKLYDSMSVTLNRVAKETRKQPYFLENESRRDAIYRLMDFGLFYVEYDLMQILYDLYYKIKHIPTKNKIINRMETLMGRYNIKDPLTGSAIKSYSLICSFADEIAFKSYEDIWNDDKSDLVDIQVTIQDEKLIKYNDAEVQEVINFCMKEYRKTIKFIQKCMDENEITCEIIGDCYLDNGII